MSLSHESCRRPGFSVDASKRRRAAASSPYIHYNLNFMNKLFKCVPLGKLTEGLKEELP
jgi:hypothetical protein